MSLPSAAAEAHREAGRPQPEMRPDRAWALPGAPPARGAALNKGPP